MNRMSKIDPRVVAVIPARWASSRFPGKPLAEIAGEPMIAHVVRRASEASMVSHVIVATDDERIAEAARTAGAEAVMTGDCPSGTDRVAEAVAGRDEWDLVVNVQGDEPLLSGENIDVLVQGCWRTKKSACRPFAGPSKPLGSTIPTRSRWCGTLTGGRSISRDRRFLTRDPGLKPKGCGVSTLESTDSAATHSRDSSNSSLRHWKRRRLWNSCAPWRTGSRSWFSMRPTRRLGSIPQRISSGSKNS